MDRRKASKELMELFIRMVRKYNALEKIPVKLESKHTLYHSERHMLDRIGDHPGMNITDFAGALGVTKGAISQVVKKLEAKGVVRRYKSGTNGKEVLLELTGTGRDIYSEHQKTNEATLGPLLRELNKYPDDKVRFLVDVFKWIDGFLDRSGKDVKESPYKRRVFLT
jgi:DNA-binding MarR family transcriptional regulator